MCKLSSCILCLAVALGGCCSNQECSSGSKPKDGNDCDCCAAPSRAAIVAKAEEGDAVALKAVTFDAFAKEVKAHQGKVVCAYLWTSTSAPSKKNLPLLMELKRKLGKDGLVCLTVSNDDAKTRQDALAHLRSLPCTLTNYVQDEKDVSDGWTSCFGCCGFPVLIILGRDGKQAGSFEVTELPFEAASVERALAKALAVK